MLMLSPRLLLRWALLVGAAATVSASQPRRMPEYLVKAEFMAFVGQAAKSFKVSVEHNQDFRLGVVGQSPFAGYLDQVYARRTIHGKPVKVVFPRTPEEAAACQMIFICRSEGDRLEEILGWVKGRPVITVGDSKGFLSRDVMVDLSLDGERIVIWVNLEAAKRGGIRFAPDFLELVRIYPGRKDG